MCEKCDELVVIVSKNYALTLDKHRGEICIHERLIKRDGNVVLPIEQDIFAA